MTDQEVVEFYSRNAVNSIPGAPKLDLRGAVDGQRKLTVHRPLPTTSHGRTFELRNRLVGIYDKGNAGSSFETEQKIVDAGSGEVYSTTQTMNFLPRQGNWGGPRGRDLRRAWLESEEICAATDMLRVGPKSAAYPPPPRSPDAVHTKQTDDTTVFLYR